MRIELTPVASVDLVRLTKLFKAYSEVSLIQREIAVTIFRGARRVDCAVIQLCIPLIARVRPSISAR